MKPDDPKVPVHIKLPTDLLEKVDRMSTHLQLNRSLMISLLVQAALEHPDAMLELVRKTQEGEQ